MSEEMIYAMLLVVLVVGVVWIVLDPHWNRRLTRWALERNYTLLDFKTSGFSESPSGLRRNSAYKGEFHVTVRDAQGRKRTGWIAYTNQFGLWTYRLKDVIWDSEWH